MNSLNSHLHLYRTLWRWTGDYAVIAREAAEAGFAGLEGQVPPDPARRDELLAALRDHGLDFICEITTAGSYVPKRASCC